MKTFAWLLVKVVGIPTTIIAILYLLRIRIDQQIVDSAAKVAWDWGPLFVGILLLLVGAESTHRVINPDRKKYDDDFYAANSQARIERAHLLFFDLYLKGKRAKAGIPEDKNNWDREVQRALRKYCNDGAVSIYLSNTGRYEPGTDFNPIPEDKFDWALEHVWDLLQSKFEHRFKI